MEELAARPVHALVGVGAEVVALGLDQIGRQPLVTVAVVKGQGAGHGRDGDPRFHRPGDHPPPGPLRRFHLLPEIRVEQQVAQGRVPVEGFFDFAQKDGADDTPVAPQQGDAAVVQVPAVLLGRRPHQHVALGVGDDLGRVQRVADVVDEGLFITVESGGGTAQNGRGGYPFLLEGRQETGKDRLADEGEGDAHVQGGGGGPLAGPLLAGGVEDFFHQRLAVLVFEGQDVAGDLDEVRVELPLVPLAEDGAHLVGGHAQALFHQVVGFGDELHVAVFDAIVDHFDEVAGAVLAHPVAAGGAVVHFGGDGLEDGLDVRPGVRRAAGHDGRSVTRALLAPGDAGADVKQPFGFDVLGAAHRIVIVGVAAVNDDVARLQMGDELLDEGVHRGAGFDHQHHPARTLEGAHQLLDGMGADDFRAPGVAVDEVVHFRHGTVENGYGEAVVVHIQNQILPHHRQADEANVCFGR